MSEKAEILSIDYTSWSTLPTGFSSGGGSSDRLVWNGDGGLTLEVRNSRTNGEAVKYPVAPEEAEDILSYIAKHDILKKGPPDPPIPGMLTPYSVIINYREEGGRVKSVNGGDGLLGLLTELVNRVCK